MKKWCKIQCLEFIVVLLMVLFGITNNIRVVQAETYGDFEYSLINGRTEIEITNYKGSDTELVIPSEIEGKVVTSIGMNAFSDCSSLTSVEIPEGIKVIGALAFSGLKNLENIQIPESVTTIGFAAFQYTGLRSLEIPKNVTKIYSGIGTEEGEHFDAFRCCSNLEKITVSKDNPVYNDGNGCNAIIETSSKTLICGCSSTKIPEGITKIGNLAFIECSNLTSIEIPSSVTSVGVRAFEGCSNLTSIEVPSSVTSIGWNAFKDCSSLASIEIPSSVTSIGDSTFSGCSSLASIEIPSSVTSIGGEVFDRTPWLTNKRKENPIVIVNDIAIHGKTCEGNITIPDGVTSIVGSAFANCYNLTGIEIPSSVASIGDNAFKDCSSLASIEIPSSVTSIGDLVFSGCSSLISVEIPSGVTSIGDWWAFDEDITLIVTPGSYAETYAKGNNIPYIYSGERWTVTIKNSNGQVVKTLHVDKGGILSAPQPSEERTNEIFLGFYNGDTKFDFSKPITSDITLTEKWEEKKENPEKPENPVTPPQEGGIILSKETLSFDTIGVTQILTATGTDAADKPVTWTSSDEKVAIVTDGVVTSVGNGMAVITVKSEDGKTATATVTVSQKTTKLSIQLNGQSVSGTLKAKVKKSYCFKAVVTPSNADAKNAALTWTSSNKKIATVTSKGKVTIKKAGKVTITAKTADGRKTTIKLNATKKAVKVTKLKITGSKTMKVKAKQTLILKLLPATADNQKVTWKSSNKKIATVNSKGVVTAKKAGKVTITATAKDGSRKKATIKITVKK